ncbi:MAG: hypothetical protein KKB30_06460 [Proteobacteria bacterium]|nr:hypothetical protein [Pseudomonadota bacterium]MBU1715162.1 hypothetical protein [Pseudomonadota bacterium]
MRHRFVTIVLALCLFFPTSAACEVVTAAHIPWSGYWWPLRTSGLATGYDYRGHPSPLEKYDLLNENRYPATTTNWYLANLYDPAAPYWYGHCGAWSKAAMTETYPILPSSEDNIIFRVGDKKGLLTLSHRLDRIQMAGGDSPADFHYWLLSYLKDQKVAFVADLDLSEEVWFFPIYKYDMQSSISGNTESVTVTIYHASDNVVPDFMGTEIASVTYTYTLQLDGSGNIISGAWTDDSLLNHPDMLVFPLAQHTDAQGLDYEKVKQIAANSDDFLEQPGATVPLVPGAYNLVLLDEDRYSIRSPVGEEFSVQITKQEGSLLPLQVLLAEGDGTVIYQGSIPGASGSLKWQVAGGGNSPFLLTLTQAGYDDPNIYSLTLDQKKGYMQQMPYLPKNSMWSGFALTNDTEVAVEDVMLTTHDAKGMPLQTVLGPLTLAPGEKRSVLFDSLPWRRHERSSTAGITLLADERVQLVNLIANEDVLAGQIQRNAVSDHLIIPDTEKPRSYERTMVGSVRNETLATIQVTLRSHNMDGSLVGETVQTLEGHGVQTISPGSAPFYSMPDKGWIEVVADSGRMVSGFVYLKSQQSAEAIFGLAVNNDPKYVPHVPPPAGDWLTTLTLINAATEENLVQLHALLAGSNVADDLTVTLAPHEKRTIVLSDDFGRLFGDPLYHSMVQVEASGDFVGYFSYQSQDSGEEASYPLLETSNFNQTLTMPHYPALDEWWVGMGVCNPSGIAQTVFVEGYDLNGELLTGETRELLIPAGGYEVFTVRDLFRAAAPDISFIKCRTETPGGVIGGFFLYGGNGNILLGGSVM